MIDLSGQRILVTQSQDFMGPALCEQLRACGAEVIAEARLLTSRIEYASPKGHGSVKAYLARPASASVKLPSVLVVHENRGLNPHIEDITRRLALDGYLAFAPDMLTSLGGYPGDEDKARSLFAQLDQTKTRQDFLAAAALLKATKKNFEAPQSTLAEALDAAEGFAKGKQ